MQRVVWTRVQRTRDLDFFSKGEQLMSNYICKKLKEKYFT